MLFMFPLFKRLLAAQKPAAFITVLLTFNLLHLYKPLVEAQTGATPNWRHLTCGRRKAAFHKIDFDQQRVIGNYILNFYVKLLGLIIEIDCNSHDHKALYDSQRQIYLEGFGLKLYRISDLDVNMHLHTVMVSLEDYIIKTFWYSEGE